MGSIDTLIKRTESMIEQLEQDREQQQASPGAVLCLPIKDGEPPIPYEIDHGAYIARFYVPESRTAS